ncbi:hypothetical protein [Cohnella terricola]|uniref:DUF4179 domain-containing protein n=1 Tax=Cohnella terricola TaxID=1289167 RepID=A0A559JEF3_9BACL|nr:hypothetical protein [Cohnella terricola]TVX98246.1 hypothetical protein FPZ45_16230 [Cohnella terricola]
MNREKLTKVFDRMGPDEAQRSRMRQRLLNGLQEKEHAHGDATATRSRRRGRRSWIAIPAIAIALALFVLPGIPFGSGETSAYAINVKMGEGDAVFKLADYGDATGESRTYVSYVDSRPGLEFYVEGDNIAKIEMSTENEYLYAVDWTKTQQEKYWNQDVYQKFDEERQVSIADFNLLYDKKMTMTFDENFRDYDKIWYRWTAWNMHKWASADNFSHFLGAGQKPAPDAEPKEKAEMAGGNGSGIGHMQLEDYPDELKKDRITIAITDRNGHRTTKVIAVNVANNELGQTVVTARLLR